MAQLRYTGSVDKTLIDVAALTTGTVFTVDDDFASRLLAAFPSEYETVQDVATVEPAPAPAQDTTSEDATPPTTSKKSSTTN